MQEESESGSPIYRYTEDDLKEFQLASGESSMEEICDHVEQHVGPIEMVFHEIVSNHVHIDVHWVKPSEEHPFHTFVTTGMSDRPMNVPPGMESLAYAELSICLPADWDISMEAFKIPKHYWPVEWLKMLARFPHEFNTWLGYGHTMPNGDPAQPFAPETNLNTMLLLPSVVFAEDFHKLELENKIINFFTLVPIYQEELELKMKKGVTALFEGFNTHGVSDVLDLNRTNTVAPKKFFGLF